MNITSEWKYDPDKKQEEHWIELIYNYYPDGEYWDKAIVKWDGCIHLSQALNSPFPRKENDCDQYIHISDIDEMINKLTKLKEFAIKHFGEDWNK